MTMSLLHPLAEPVLQWTNHYNHANIDFSDPRPVLVDDNIYMKGECDKHGQLSLWKYSISSHRFYEIQCPPHCRRNTTVLTSCNSRLLLLCASYINSSNLHLSMYEMQEKGWGESVNLHTLECRVLQTLCGSHGYQEFVCSPECWDVLATSHEGNLFVGFIRLYRLTVGPKKYINRYQVMIFDKKYKLVNCAKLPEISVCDGYIKDIQPAIFTHNGDFYIKFWKEFDSDKEENLKKVCCDSLYAKPDNTVEWSDAHSMPNEHSNVTFIDNQPIIGVVTASSPDEAAKQDSKLYLCTLSTCNTPTGDAWVEVVSIGAHFYPPPVVIALPDSNKVMVIGMHTNSSGNRQLHALEVTPQGM